MRKLAMVLGAFVLASATLAPASASHPTWICIDAGPEGHTAVANDDVVDVLTITVGASDDGHPPQTNGCVVAEGGDWQGTVIHVEVTGAADGDGDTPSSPDLTCTVPPGSNRCSVEPPTSWGGTQTLRAWLDGGEATPIDRTEGPNEDNEPGELGEPDMTDVSEWMWTHVDPPPCEFDCPMKSRVTIEYRRWFGVFRGEIFSGYGGCKGNRWVRLWKKRPGRDRARGRVYVDYRGRWRLDGFDGVRGRFYAVAAPSTVGIPDTEPPQHVDCLEDQSRTIDVG